jgi:hypothetical protein
VILIVGIYESWDIWQSVPSHHPVAAPLLDGS